MKYIYKITSERDTAVFKSNMNPDAMDDYIYRKISEDNLIEVEDMNTNELFVEFATDVEVTLVKTC